MRLINTPDEMAEAVAGLRAEGRTVGLVPTMGSLHEGHLSLVRAAREAGDTVALSIFVNPAQFGPGEDFDRYPRDLDGDMEKCRASDVELVFAPDTAGMYPHGHSTHVEVSGVSGGLCGAARPGHFRGVATVVAKLLNIVRPDRAYFGRKDYQQAVVIKRMVKDLHMGADVVLCPTVRESDGLAMSSRNAYLDPPERMAAAQIYRALAEARRLMESGETGSAALVSRARESLYIEPLIKPEYVEVVDPNDLRRLSTAVDGAVLMLAVRIGGTRLIDNLTL